VTLAEEMIRLSGFRPYEDIDISYIGLRPGEKLFEELFLDGEGIRQTSHEKIMIAQAAVRNWKTLNRQLEDLYEATQKLDTRRIIAILQQIVPEYRTERKPYLVSVETELAAQLPVHAPHDGMPLFVAKSRLRHRYRSLNNEKSIS
jgi:FlaA1/EpsC-like NDP-sugar epimerase